MPHEVVVVDDMDDSIPQHSYFVVRESSCPSVSFTLLVSKRRLPVDPTRSYPLSFCWETLVGIDSIPNGNGCSAAAETRIERNSITPHPNIPALCHRTSP